MSAILPTQLQLRVRWPHLGRVLRAQVTWVLTQVVAGVTLAFAPDAWFVLVPLVTGTMFGTYVALRWTEEDEEDALLPWSPLHRSPPRALAAGAALYVAIVDTVALACAGTLWLTGAIGPILGFHTVFALIASTSLALTLVEHRRVQQVPSASALRRSLDPKACDRVELAREAVAALQDTPSADLAQALGVRVVVAALRDAELAELTPPSEHLAREITTQRTHAQRLGQEALDTLLELRLARIVGDQGARDRATAEAASQLHRARAERELAWIEA